MSVPHAVPRLPIIDAARGAAIIGVAVYHFFWDLSFLWLIPVDVTVHAGWLAFARTLLFSFIFLAGVGLVLGHGNGFRAEPFWRRLALIAGAALLVSLGTFIAFRDTFVFFGVLHAIALFSLLALPFVFWPVWASLLLGPIVIALPALFASDAFNTPWLAWIGFFTAAPPTNDLVPIFPWFGVALLGVGLTRLALGAGLAARLAGWAAEGQFASILRKAGKWSLWIYLVHQPILLAILWPVATYALPQVARVNSFEITCNAGCVAGGTDAGSCDRYCACALGEIETRDAWAAIEALDPTPAQSQAVNEVIGICTAELPTGLYEGPVPPTD